MFEPFIRAMGQHVNIVSVSYSSTDDVQSYEHLQNIAAASIPREGRVVVLGESFSGPIAISLAAQMPERIAGVVLCCSFLRNPRPGLRWLRGLLSIPAPAPPLPLVYAMLLGRLSTSLLRQMLQHTLEQVPPVVLRARLQAVLDVDVRARARELRVPVLYLRANNDRLVPAKAAADAQRHCKGMTIQGFDAPHCLLQTVPELASRAVASFVNNAVAALGRMRTGADLQ